MLWTGRRRPVGPRPATQGSCPSRRAAWTRAELLKRLRDLARPPQDVPFSTFDLNAAVTEAIEFIQPHLHDGGAGQGNLGTAHARACAPGRCLVSGSPAPWREVLMNLILNAIEAMPEGGDLGIETCATTGGETSRRDTGMGMSEEGPRPGLHAVLHHSQLAPPASAFPRPRTSSPDTAARSRWRARPGGLHRSPSRCRARRPVPAPSMPLREPALPWGLRARRGSTSVISATSCASSSGAQGCSVAIVRTGRAAPRPSSGTGLTPSSPPGSASARGERLRSSNT